MKGKMGDKSKTVRIQIAKYEYEYEDMRLGIYLKILKSLIIY